MKTSVNGKVSAAVLLVASVVGMALPAQATETGRTVLVTGGYWRTFAMCRPEIIPLDVLKKLKPKATEPLHVGFGRGVDVYTTGPEEGWTEPDFDDHAWGRYPGPFAGGTRGHANWYRSDGTSLICLRGRFEITDPAKIKKLTLTANYWGGLIIYLNGKEIARGHMPKGEIAPDTLAELYPREAYVDAKGKLVMGNATTAILEKKGEKELAARVALRTARKIKAMTLPTELLRKGVNVLALEVHRSGFRPARLKDARRWGRGGAWEHMGLSAMRLTADGDEIEQNMERPKGVQVWNEDIHKLFSAARYGDPNEPLRPIRLTGPRNGYYSGQVVVSSVSVIKNVKAVVTDLARKGGGTISASNIQVRWPAIDKYTGAVRCQTRDIGLTGRTAPGFGPLMPAAPDTVDLQTFSVNARKRKQLGLTKKIVPAAAQPVWITVYVPKDAAIGKYHGTLTVSCDGLPGAEVPIELDVVGWALPDARDFRTTLGLYQSPETISVYYKAPMWSEKHLNLLESSWRLLAYLGNNFVTIPLTTRTQLGNDESMIPWIKQKDGTYEYDFKAYDAYLALALKHCRIETISYQIWHGKGWEVTPPDAPTSVTVVDAATGKRTSMKLPACGTEEGKRLWKQFVAAIRQHNKKLDLDEKVNLVIGISQDCGVNKQVIAHFKEVFPEAMWHYAAHHRPRSKLEKEQFGYSEYVYVGSLRRPAKQGVSLGWRKRPLILSSPGRVRDGAFNHRPMYMRTSMERALLLGDAGWGRMGLDWWPVEGSTKGSLGGGLFSRWPGSTAAQRSVIAKVLAFPGSDGAIGTNKLEAFREGMQESEARIFIEEALADGKIKGDIALRCRKILDKKADFLRVYHWWMRRMECAAYDEGWQKHSEDIYHLVAEVAKKLNDK